jgi:hypothetical protein
MRKLLALSIIALAAYASPPVSAQSISPAPPFATAAGPATAPAKSTARQAASAPSASDSEHPLTAAEDLHKKLGARNSALLTRGEVCAQMLRDGKLPRTTTAQYRCILGG